MIFFRKKLFIWIILFLVFVSSLVFLYFFYKPTILLENKNTGLSEVRVLTKKVGKILFVPEDEIPTVATVTDLDALKGQTFFEDAKIGDKVLIYSKSKKAVLYDPIANKIITIAPVNLNKPQRFNEGGLHESNQSEF